MDTTSFIFMVFISFCYIRILLLINTNFPIKFLFKNNLFFNHSFRDNLMLLILTFLCLSYPLIKSIIYRHYISPVPD